MTMTLWATDDPVLHFSVTSLAVANALLWGHHYLGPSRRAELVVCGEVGREVRGVQVWAKPTSRRLPQDGTWLELARWCLTPAAGKNAGSKMHGWAVRCIRHTMPEVTTLVSYSDPSAGHSGSLYKACNWEWKPTWHRLRPPPSGNGSWTDGTKQSVKDRWVFSVKADPRRAELLRVKDESVLRSLEDPAA